MDLSEVEKFETPIKITKLSEAIRIGSRNTKQSLTSVDYIEEDGNTCCAFGAAALALGHKYGHGLVRDVLNEHFGPDTVARMGKIYVQVYGTNLHFDVADGIPREIIADRFAALGY